MMETSTSSLRFHKRGGSGARSETERQKLEEQCGITQDQNPEEEVDRFPPRPVKKAATWLVNTPKPIERFIHHHSPEHYQALAERAQGLIESALKNLRDSDDQEIQAKVTCRAKTGKSLEEKLKMRNLERKRKGKKEYETDEEILEDVKDLAGVRVVLYTPNEDQREKVKRVIKSIWGDDVDEKPHEGSVSPTTSGPSLKSKRDTGGKKKEYIRKHLGYRADHYRTPMTKEQSTDSYQWKKYDWVEIQVVSALGHAWAEAGHDVLYKTHAYGPPSIQEQRILDALSGLIVSGDLLLEQFRELVTKRTTAKWEHPEQFVIFLRQTDVLETQEGQYAFKGSKEPQEGFRSDAIDILFRFLQGTGNDYPLAVRNALKDLGYPQESEIGLSEVLSQFNPSLTPPQGLLTPLCMISHMLSLDERKGKRTAITEEPDVQEMFSIMMDALILLQTFAGGPGCAKALLLVHQVQMTVEETESLNFLLSDPSRKNCFAGAVVKKWIKDSLQTAWRWFEKQANDDKSLCGLFFRLANMGVPAKVMDDPRRLKELKINSLSRSNTLEDQEGWK